MRILQLTPRIAWPPTDGGRVVMLQVVRALERLGAHVEVLSLNPRKQRVDVDAARRVLAPVRLDAVDVDTSAHARALLRSFPLRAPQLVARFFSPRFESELRARLRDGRFDVVQIESPFLLPYVRAIRESSSAAIALRSLNVEFRIWERLAMSETNVVRRLALRTIARRLRRYEVAQLDVCDAIIPITEADARDFRALGCTRAMYVLSGGVEVDDSSRIADRGSQAHPSEARILGGGSCDLRSAIRDLAGDLVGFLGSLDYRPNQEAAIWIAEQLRPRMRVETELHVAGARAPEWLRARLVASGVVFDGEVEDAAAFVRGMGVMIAPILSGGGMRIKILEAMAAGKAVVTTTIGAEGIDVRDGVNALIADDAEGFAAAIESLLSDPERARAIGGAGRALVETRYSADALTRGLLAFYEELKQSRRVGGGL
jgi:glycosyltransferase involved in cell wall biosynthesis